MVAVVLGDAQQHILESRQSVAGLRRKIGAAEKRPLVIVCEEHGERPAATSLCEHLLRDLVDAVDVGTLFAINLDVDEVLVEQARGGFVFETFSFEDVTPPAG